MRPPSAFPSAGIVEAFAERGPLAVAPGARLVQLETTANAAVGTVPWGIATVLPDVLRLREGEPLPAGPLVLVGRDLHRHPWIVDVVARARDSRPTLVVDMGWPDLETGPADLATFGASRAVAAALLERLGLPEVGAS